MKYPIGDYRTVDVQAGADEADMIDYLTADLLGWILAVACDLCDEVRDVVYGVPLGGGNTAPVGKRFGRRVPFRYGVYLPVFLPCADCRFYDIVGDRPLVFVQSAGEVVCAVMF